MTDGNQYVENGIDLFKVRSFMAQLAKRVSFNKQNIMEHQS